MKNKTGRPSKYTPELANEICEAIATSSKGINTLCSENEDWPVPSTITDWILKDKEGFSVLYARAKERQADFMAEEILSIADDGRNDTYTHPETGLPMTNHDVINRSRLRVDSRKWLASKLAPKKYGDKLDLNHGGNMAVTTTDVELEALTPELKKQVLEQIRKNKGGRNV